MALLKDICWQLADPWFFMACSMYYLPGTLFDLARTGDFAVLLSWERFQTKWFGRFWSWAGPMVRATGEARVVPLLEGRVAHGAITESAVKAGIRGTVMEVGAGSGMWIELFLNDYQSKHSKTIAESTGAETSNKHVEKRGEGRIFSGRETKLHEPLLGRGLVTKVYGIEPNPQSYEALSRRVKEKGLEEIYEVVPVGIEQIGSRCEGKWDSTIEKESVDCIVSILCLCSIPNPQENIAELYRYLKPGGTWYVYEHVCCDKDTCGTGMVWYQWMVQQIWGFVMGGCCLTRDTTQFLLNAGPWSNIDIARPTTEPWYHVVPHVYGVFTK